MASAQSHKEADDAGVDVEAHVDDVQVEDDDEPGKLSVYDVVGNVKPVTLDWRDIVLRVPLKAETRTFPWQDPPETKYKTILEHVDGKARPGEFIAIMGSSGAGKTSLLNVIARRVAQTEGQVLVNNKPADKTFTRMSAYVQQEDLFLSSLTVREHLKFQIALKLGESITESEKESRVDSLISALGLTKVKDSLIGDPAGKKGISGGEKKRLSVASEIITNPSLLFADEPTSGLDSYMAESIVKLLKKLAQAGRTVITTIHQPSSEVYHLFDKLMLIREGEIVYFGPKDDAVTYFGAIDSSLQCPRYTNPADFFLRSLSVFDPQHPSYDLVSKLGQTWKECEMSKKLLEPDSNGNGNIVVEDDENGTQPASDAMAVSEDGDDDMTSRYPISKLKQFQVLVSRAIIDTSRNPYLTYARAMQTVILALVAGAIFWRLGFDQSSIQGRNGAIFFIIVNQSFSGVFGVLQSFPLEKPIFLREHASGNYAVSSYYFAKMVSDLPFQVFFPVLFCVIAFWMMQLHDDFWRFAAITGIVVLTANAAMSMGYAVSAAVSSVGVALALGPTILLPMLLTGGFFTNTEQIPEWLTWLEHISFIRYGFQASGEILWDGTSLSCSDVAPDEPCRDGNGVLRQFFPDRNFSLDIVALICILVGLRALTYFALRSSAAKHRHKA